jgi:predicted nuclease of restriction endonuclease-like RecB superfamily
VEQFSYHVEHWYIPDWRIVRKDGSVFFVETKGYWTSQDRSKIKKIIEQHPDIDLRLVFQYDNKLHKKSNTRYSDWCNKHDIPYAIGCIPEDWFTNE